MAHSFLLLTLLKEANDFDNLLSRRQREKIRNTQLIIREDDYVRLFRLTKQLVDDVEENLESTLKTTKTLNSRTKILCTLAFLASGSYQRIIAANIFSYVSQPTMSRCIHDVVDALSHPDIVRKFIRFPQNSQERQLLKERFYQKFNINGCIGCVDGTFVAMIRPKEDEERYYCRKGYHARNVQLIVDADLNILHVDASYGGSFHDSFIFNNCVIKEHLEALNDSNETVFLLGDSAYCQRAYMMVPVPNVANGSPEATYNKVHATARNSVERLIGILKGRFRCLLVHRVLHYSPNTVGKITIACCVLHNICNRAGLIAPELSTEELTTEIMLQGQYQYQRDGNNEELELGRLARARLIRTIWHNSRPI